MLHIAVDHDASEIRLVNGQLDVRNDDGILSTTRLRGQEVQLMLPPPPPPAKPDTGPRPDILQAVDDVTRKLIEQVGQSATDTQKRIGSSFTSYLVMIAVLFAVSSAPAPPQMPGSFVARCRRKASTPSSCIPTRSIWSRAPQFAWAGALAQSSDAYRPSRP